MVALSPSVSDAYCSWASSSASKSRRSKGSHNRIAQVGENLAQTERKPTTSLEQVVWQAVEVSGLGVQYDHQFCLLASIPAGTELGLVGIPKGDVILERNQFKSPLTNARENAFFQK